MNRRLTTTDVLGFSVLYNTFLYLLCIVPSQKFYLNPVSTTKVRTDVGFYLNKMNSCYVVLSSE